MPWKNLGRIWFVDHGINMPTIFGWFWHFFPPNEAMQCGQIAEKHCFFYWTQLFLPKNISVPSWFCWYIVWCLLICILPWLKKSAGCTRSCTLGVVLLRWVFLFSFVIMSKIKYVVIISWNQGIDGGVCIAGKHIICSRAQ